MPFDPPEHLSPSSWNLWEQCPRKWAAKYHAGIVDPTNMAAEAGGYAHKVLEHVYNEEPKHRTIDGARAIAGHMWDPHVAGAYPRDKLTTVTSGQVSETELDRKSVV